MRDGFAFYAQVPCQIYFDLVIHDSFSDFDVCLYDPYFQSVVACWETPFNPESGDFAVLDAGTSFHLFVEPYLGSAEYSLYVSVYPWATRRNRRSWERCALAPAERRLLS